MLVRANLPRLGERADRVLAVGMENYVPIAILDGRKRAHDRAQLGDVARCFADVLGDLFAVAPAGEHDSDAGWPRGARARAIGEGKDRVGSPSSHERSIRSWSDTVVAWQAG